MRNIKLNKKIDWFCILKSTPKGEGDSRIEIVKYSHRLNATHNCKISMWEPP
jgi:hypothetical protein